MHPTLPSVLSVTGLLFLACCTDLASAADAPNVTWIAPAAGDSYASGGTIVGRWASEDTVVSPSFRICVTDGGNQVSARSSHGDDGDNNDDDSGEDDDDGGNDDDGKGKEEESGGADSGDDSEGGSCGEAVWPTIGLSEDGSHFIHLSLPNVTAVAQCYLEMVDNFGDKMVSPTFSFGGSADAQSTDAASAAAADSQSGSSSADANNPAATSPATTDSSNSPDSVNSADSANSANSANSASTPSGTGLGAVFQTPSAPQTLPSLDESHVPVPTAAYAVPLSLVGSVILAAGGLSVHQRRKLRNERLQEQAYLAQARGGAPALSRHSTLSFAGFMNLGSRPHSSRAPSSMSISRVPRVDKQPYPQSRSTSVNRTRAWRRDVSHHHERRPEYLPRLSDEDTLAWRSEDAHSVRSSGEYMKGFTALPVRQEPRRATREPFHASSGGGGRARRTTIPTSAFWAGASPVFPLSDTDSFCSDGYGGGGYGHRTDHSYTKGGKYDEVDEDEEWGRLKRKGRTLVDPGPLSRDAARGGGGGEAYLNASVNDSVMERYFNTSPVPPALSPGGPPRRPHSDALARPERLYVKRYADGGRHGEDRGGLLPPAPKDTERDLYDAVARRIARDPDA
ncbi:hypothetical protein C8Q73DRAFT_792560 [Cubamyces lactineus]|nr:hypothetical protein C8Q73DRAFT_792560 [Cubamyces lactineus]